MLGAFNFWWMATLTLFAVLKVEATVTGEKWCNSVRGITALFAGSYLSYNASYSVSMCYW